jgi:hypothetical protein
VIAPGRSEAGGGARVHDHGRREVKRPDGVGGAVELVVGRLGEPGSGRGCRVPTGCRVPAVEFGSAAASTPSVGGPVGVGRSGEGGGLAAAVLRMIVDTRPGTPGASCRGAPVRR